VNQYIDWSSQVGIMGYSMGGLATMNTASNQDAVSRFNIGAAVLQHPASPFNMSGALRKQGKDDPAFDVAMTRELT